MSNSQVFPQNLNEMSEIKEMQDEEKEALISIYEGDQMFKQISDSVYQYKVNK